jgi:hypothetical protein
MLREHLGLAVRRLGRMNFERLGDPRVQLLPSALVKTPYLGTGEVQQPIAIDQVRPERGRGVGAREKPRNNPMRCRIAIPRRPALPRWRGTA